MRVLDGEMTLARIFFGESDRFHHVPLHRALVERLRREGFAGATVFRAIEGYGARSVVHTSGILDLSTDLPIVVEVVDTDAHMERLLAILDEMASGVGLLVTMERARVVRYAAGAPRK